MNQRISYLFTVCLLAGAVLASPVHAQTKAAKASPSEAKETTPVRIPFSGKLSAVDKAAPSITLDGKAKKRTIRLTAQTRIMKAGKPATLEEAAIGDEVGGQAIKNAEGQEEAVSLRLGPKPEPESKRKKNSKGDGEAKR